MIIKKNKLPTLMGVALLLVGTFLGVLLINSRTIFKLGASGDFEPSNIRTSNISGTSFTISWTTSKESVGFVSWGESNSLGKIEKETQSDQKFLNHSITLSGLLPSTVYYYKINSGGTLFDNKGIPWQTTTKAESNEDKDLVLVSGSVLTATGQAVKRALVYINVDGEQFSTLTSDSGNFVFRLKNADPETTLLEVSVQAGPAGISSAQIYLKSARSIPPMILGNTHDFKNLPATSDSQSPDSLLNPPSDTNQESKFTIPDSATPSSSQTVTLNSTDEGETVTSTQPEFFGEGPAGAALTITIESESPISDSVNVGSGGSWKWSPPENLSSGVHKITITWKDISGITRTLTRNFVVQAGEAPAFEASESAATATPSPTATPKVSPTPSASVSATPIPETGSLTPTFLLSIMGIGVMALSFSIWKYAQSI